MDAGADKRSDLLQELMAVFDDLPAALREAINYAPEPLDPKALAVLCRRHGAANVLAMIELKLQRRDAAAASPRAKVSSPTHGRGKAHLRVKSPQKGESSMMHIVASEGGYQAFTLHGAEKGWLYFALAAGVLSVLVAVNLMRGVLAADQLLPTSWQHSLLQMSPMCPRKPAIWTIWTPADGSGGRVRG